MVKRFSLRVRLFIDAKRWELTRFTYYRIVKPLYLKWRVLFEDFDVYSVLNDRYTGVNRHER